MGTSLCVSVMLLAPAFLLVVRLLRVRTWGRCRAEGSQRGRVAVVTGAASGLGLETARAIAARGAIVVLACRDEQRAQEAKRRILDAETGLRAENLLPMAVNLGSLASVRQFVKQLMHKVPHVHMLVCNAGVYFPTRVAPKTDDGFEAHLGVNHLSHFLLVHLLLARMKESAPSRIVVVASSLFEKSVDTFSVANIPPGYSSSKLANVLFAKELAVRTAGTGVGVYAVCPGFCYTGLFRSRDLRWYHYLLMAPVAFFFMRTAEQGSQTILHCALSDEVKEESGFIYKDCKHYEPRKKPSSQVAAELWTVSERMVGLRPPLTASLPEGELSSS